jgi:hypothetical protein
MGEDEHAVVRALHVPEIVKLHAVRADADRPPEDAVKQVFDAASGDTPAR